MKNILKNRRALSTVVTTLIILVVSVLLAGVVTYFAINIVSTSTQQESLNLQYQHVWYSTMDQMAEAAIMITNTGGRDVVLQNIAVRGNNIPTTDIWYFVPKTIADLTYVNQSASDKNQPGPIGLTTVAPIASSGDFLQITTGPITLTSGSTIAVYMAGSATYAPGSITVNDVGLTIAISVFTAQATYIKETNVNAV
jgi:hypothetical protein